MHAVADLLSGRSPDGRIDAPRYRSVDEMEQEQPLRIGSYPWSVAGSDRDRDALLQRPAPSLGGSTSTTGPRWFPISTGG